MQDNKRRPTLDHRESGQKGPFHVKRHSFTNILHLGWKGSRTGLRPVLILLQQKILHTERGSLCLWSPNILDSCFFAVLYQHAVLYEEGSGLFRTGGHLWPPILHFFAFIDQLKIMNAALPSSGLQKEWQWRSAWSPIPQSTPMNSYILLPWQITFFRFATQSSDIAKIQTTSSYQKKLCTPWSAAMQTERH